MSANQRDIGWYLLTAFFLMGMWLRLWGLSEQVVVDDEWHVLHEILYRPLRWPLWDSGWTEAGDHYSAPLALLFRGLESSVGLTETRMRALPLACGLVAPAVLPLILRGWIGRNAAVRLAVLLSASPFLIYFSRLARPYSVSLLLSYVALGAFWRWWRDGTRVGASLFLICAILAPYFHASTVPVVLAPFGYVILTERSRLGAVRRFGWLGLVVVVSLGMLVVVPTLLDQEWMERGALDRPPNFTTLRKALELWLGTGSGAVVTLVLAVAVAGAVRLVRSCRSQALYWGIAALAQISSLLALRPRGMSYGIVLARFGLFLCPLLLAAVAAGLSSVEAALKSRARWAPTGAATLVIVALTAITGPLPRIYRFPNNFTGHGSLQMDYDPSYLELFRPARVAEVYQYLQSLQPWTSIIVEAPWFYYWHSYAYAQRIHRQRVLIGFVDYNVDKVRVGEIPRSHTGIRLQNAVHVSNIEDVRSRGVDLVLLHKKPHEELEFPFPFAAVDMTQVIDLYRGRCGEPEFDDELVAVFRVSECS